MKLRVLIAPSGFKESLDADQVALHIARGVQRALPDAELTLLPFVDGGEGFSRILCELTHGVIHTQTATGPLGEPVEAHFGFLGGDGPRTAIIEMAATSGLRLIPMNKRDPTQTTTRGVGELIQAALTLNAEVILIGCGDSGTNDAGAGAAQVLGVRLLDAQDHEIGMGGAELLKLARIDTSHRDARLQSIDLQVSCNWQNILCGPSGVARSYGPQKGATSAQTQVLEDALEHFAAIIQRDTGIDVRAMPGGGASGGLGAGLHALLGAVLYPRMEVVSRFLDFERHLAHADLVITAEGRVDRQTLRGKVPMEIALLAKRFRIPVIALTGEIALATRPLLESGIDAVESILNAPCTLAEALRDTASLLEDGAEQTMRLILVGERLLKQQVAAQGSAVRTAKNSELCAEPLEQHRLPAVRPKNIQRQYQIDSE